METQGLDEYWDLIRQRVFARCVDERDGAGNVLLTNEAECTIKRFLPDIVNIVKTVQSDRLDSYIDALHKNVCVKCEFAKPDGSCEQRDRADCCLDRYFPLVVEVLSE
ncbi:MAG: hypothetical protein AABZ61_02500 [Bacteroidota bacterium]